MCVACSSSPPPAQSDAGAAANPSIDVGDDDAGFRTLVDLTLKERKTLCDWSAQIAGGYGHTTTCDAGLVVNHPSQQACISQYLGACYSAKVIEWIACQKKIAADPCSLPLFNAPECKPVLKCAGLVDGGPPPPPDDGGM